MPPTQRKTTKSRRPSADVPDVVRLSTSAKRAPVETVPVFYIDDVEYSMPRRVHPNVGLQYLRMARDKGPEIAVVWLLEEVLGTEGYEALMGYDALTDEQLGQVMEIIKRNALGAQEKQGNG